MTVRPARSNDRIDEVSVVITRTKIARMRTMLLAWIKKARRRSGLCQLPTEITMLPCGCNFRPGNGRLKRPDTLSKWECPDCNSQFAVRSGFVEVQRPLAAAVKSSPWGGPHAPRVVAPELAPELETPPCTPQLPHQNTGGTEGVRLADGEDAPEVVELQAAAGGEPVADLELEALSGMARPRRVPAVPARVQGQRE